MRRSKKAQSDHDAEVQRIARSYQRRGFDVEADVSGFRRPGTLGGYRPDVVARRGGDRKIVEVETPESVDTARDRKQQQAFRTDANRAKKTTFTRKVTKRGR